MKIICTDVKTVYHHFMDITERSSKNLKAILRPRQHRWTEIAVSAKVSRSWIQRFMHGQIPNPGIKTLDKVWGALERLQDD